MRNEKMIQARIDSILNTKLRYSEGVMTRKEWLNMQKSRGCFVQEGTKPKVKYNRIKYNRMSNYREQEEYMNKCNEMIPCYWLYLSENTFIEITKTEFDYFNGLK